MPEPTVKHELPQEVVDFFRMRKDVISHMQAQLNGAIGLYVKEHNLEGEWRLSEDCQTLVKTS